MKYAFYSLLLVLLISCTQQPAEVVVVTEVIVTGKITNPVEGVTYLRILGKPLDLFTDTLILDSNGVFATVFEIDEPGYGIFLHGRENTTLYISPGDSIHIELDTKEFDETATFSGTNAAPSNYIIEDYLINEQLGLDYYSLYGAPLDSFLMQIDSMRLTLAKHLDAFKLANPNTSTHFLKLREAEILYTWAELKLTYPETHEQLTGNDSLQIPDNYNSYLSEVNYDDSLLIQSNAYRTFIKAYIKSVSNEALDSDTVLAQTENALTTLRFEYTKEQIKSRDLKEYLLYDLLKTQITYYGLNNIKPLVDDFTSTSSNTKYKETITTEFAKWEPLLEGEEAPNFTYPDINGDTVSLSDFRGKYVYIDIWATWCGPCKREIPYLHELEEEFADKNVVFMSVSVDETPEPWREMVTKEHLGGIQLYASGWKTAIADDYLINSIPRFILIDTEGNIIDVKAPRPSGTIGDILSNLDKINI